MTKIYYYISPVGENPVKKFLNSIPETQQTKISRIFAYIAEYGLGTYIPYVKKIVNSHLWEIRILGQNNIRVLYAVIYKGDVLLLQGFLKKKQKTPKKELRIANTRYLEWLKSGLLTK